jgi:hypothetical protein
LDKRRRELKLQERRQDKAERRKHRKEHPLGTEGDGTDPVAIDAGQIPADGDTSTEQQAPSTKED